MNRLAALLLSVLSVLALTASPAQAAAGPVIRDGESQPIYSYGDAVRETVWVNLGLDLDRDGVTDRTAVDIIRPATHGARIPVIMDVSPYYQCCGRGNERQKKTYAPDGTPTGFPQYYDNYFVPRGYAIALVDSPGTARSTGCLVGDAEQRAGVAAVNWLNGRAAGFGSPFGTDRAFATWSTGAVGVIGKSNDGENAMALATSGVPGLRTAVPIAGVGNLHDFWSPGGALIDTPTPNAPPFLDNERSAVRCRDLEQAQADRILAGDGDYTPYWRTLDFTAAAHRITASVFNIQGFQDENVNPLQFGKWWQALGANHVTRKAWLHQAGHADPFDLRRPEFVRTLHRWMDRWLLGVRNGIEHEPMIDIERSPGRWTTEPTWPPRGNTTILRPGNGGTPGLGTLTPRPGTGTERFQDSTDPDSTRFRWTADLGAAASDRVVFTSAPLSRPTRIAGSPTATITVSATESTATLGAVLVDLGPATVINAGGPDAATGLVNTGTRSCWGGSSPADSACFTDTATDLTTVRQQILSAGWTDVGHYASRYHRLPLTPGRDYTRTVELSTMDHVVPAGHRIALVVGGTDHWTIYRQTAAPRITVDLRGTSVSLPTAR